MTAFALGLLGLVLSLLVPAPLARARWTTATPAASVVLWQAVVAASVLSAVAVVLIAPEEIAGALEAGPGAAAWGLFGALAVALLIVTRLVLSLVGVMRRSAARRARHRELLDLLDDAERSAALAGDLTGDAPDDDGHRAAAVRGQLRVLGAPLPLAYGLPGRSPRVVVSDGALQLLDTDQLRAVLAHEQAHLDARHDVVLESFAAFHRAVPRPLRNERALGAVELLLEAAADDAARRRCGDAPLRTALELLGAAVDPGVGALAAADTEAERTADDRAVAAQRAQRLDRLRRPLPRRWRSAGVLALAAGVLVLPPVVLVAPWLTDALATLPLLRP